MGEEGVSLGTLAKSALEGVVSESAGMALKALFGEGESAVELSDAAYERIRDIFQTVLTEQRLEDLITNTKAVLQRMCDFANDGNVDLEALLTVADQNRAGMSGVIKYRGTDAYWAAASQSLLIYRMLYDLKAATTPKDQKTIDGAAKNIVAAAQLILTEIKQFEDNMFDGEGLEVFSGFKRYQFGEEPYADPANSPLAYMGAQYRENLQAVMGAIYKFDATGTELSKLAHPRYLINFFNFDAVRDKVLFLWSADECNPGFGRRSQQPYKGKAWMCFPTTDYKPIGDLFRSDDNSLNGTEPITIPYVKPIGKGKIAYPIDYTEVWRDNGTGNGNNMSGWHPVPPDGFAMIGSVTDGRGGDHKPEDRCVVVSRDDVEMKQTNNRTWHSAGTGSYWDGSTWDHPDPAFSQRGVFIMARTYSWPDTQVGVLTKNALTGHPFLQLNPPGPPDFDEHNWTHTAGDYGSSGRWSANYQVRYRIAFFSDIGTVLGPWWHPTNWPGSDADGFYPVDKKPKWACPTLINLSTDSAGLAAGRIIYRQFAGRDVETVAVIKDNTTTRFMDEVDVPPFGPPATAPDFDPGQWSGSVPIEGSHNWVPGYKVRYAVSFYTADQETPMGPWWHPTHWPASDPDGFFPSDPRSIWAYPMLTDIPVDPTHTATGRRIYRQFYDPDGGLSKVEKIGEITNNDPNQVFSDRLP